MDDITTGIASDDPAPIAGACPHHWLIEPATAQESRGRCTACGAEKVFSNQPASRYDRDQASPLPRVDRDFRGGRSSHRERISLSDET